jgi:YD repeat-containing protein
MTAILRQLLTVILSLALAAPVLSNSYDANGNTTASNGNAYSYDFENHLIKQGGITIVYDGDGNRVSKTVAGVTTTYLVDTQNLTGYAQVLQEIFSGGTGGWHTL